VIPAGINLLDTGDSYGMGHGEMLPRKAIDRRRQTGFHQESETDRNVSSVCRRRERDHAGLQVAIPADAIAGTRYENQLRWPHSEGGTG
jgi:hypothetical protein